MKLISTSIGRCLTRTRREDFQEIQQKYSTFIHVIQWDGRYNSKTTSVVDSEFQVSNSGELREAYLTFGLHEDGSSIEYIGQIIDSSD